MKKEMKKPEKVIKGMKKADKFANVKPKAMKAPAKKKAGCKY